MRFLENIFNTRKIKELELDILNLKANHNFLLEEYRLHIKHLHDPYKKVMTKAEEIKAENKKGKKGKVVFVENDFDIPEATCKRCNYTWVPRKETIDLCPKCKSKYWDKDYVRDVKKVAKKRHRKGNK